MKKLWSSIVALHLSLGLSACDMCENEPVRTVLSPSGKLKAVVFNRNCGATTGFNTHVSVVRASRALPDEGGNVLILDGTVPLDIAWRSDSALQLGGVGASTVFRQSHAVDGVSVRYDR